MEIIAKLSPVELKLNLSKDFTEFTVHSDVTKDFNRFGHKLILKIGGLHAEINELICKLELAHLLLISV